MFQHTNATDLSRWKGEVNFEHEGIAQYLRILQRPARKRFRSGEAPDGVARRRRFPTILLSKIDMFEFDQYRPPWERKRQPTNASCSS